MGAERGGLEVVCLVVVTQGTAKNSQGLEDLTRASYGSVVMVTEAWMDTQDASKTASRILLMLPGSCPNFSLGLKLLNSALLPLGSFLQRHWSLLFLERLEPQGLCTCY